MKSNVGGIDRILRIAIGLVPMVPALCTLWLEHLRDEKPDLSFSPRHGGIAWARAPACRKA